MENEPYSNVRRGINVRFIADCRHCGGMGELTVMCFYCQTCHGVWQVRDAVWTEHSPPLSREELGAPRGRIELLMGDF